MLFHASYCSSLAAVKFNSIVLTLCLPVHTLAHFITAVLQKLHLPLPSSPWPLHHKFSLKPLPNPSHTWHTSLFVQQHWTFQKRKGERELRQFFSVSKWIKKPNECGCTAYLKARTEEPTYCFCPYGRWFGKIAGSSIRVCTCKNRKMK